MKQINVNQSISKWNFSHFLILFSILMVFASNLQGQCLTEQIKLTLVSVQYVPPDGEALPDPRMSVAGAIGAATGNYACSLINNVSLNPTPYAINSTIVTQSIACGAALPAVTVDIYTFEKDAGIDNCTWAPGALLPDDDLWDPAVTAIDISNIRTSNVVTATFSSGPWTYNFRVNWVQIASAPGGVFSNLGLWLRADESTNTTTQGAAVTSWLDKSINGHTAANIATSPTYQVGTANFNPALNFNASGMSVPTHLIPASSQYTKIAVIKAEAATSTNAILGTTSGTGHLMYMPSSKTAVNLYQNSIALAGFATALTADRYGIATGIYVGAGNTVYGDGLLKNTTSATSATVANPTIVGAYQNGTTGAFVGKIAEVMVFHASTNAADLLKIHSYLAVKYGITLGTTASLVSYTASDNTVFWTGDATFQNNIAGIGRDEASKLIQKQSISQNNNIVAMGLGTIAATNGANVGTLTDKTFMMWGDDAQATVMATVVTGTSYVRMARCWKVQETGTVGAVQVRVPKSYFGTSAPYLIVSNDATFDNTDNAIASASSDATYYYFNGVDFTTGQYFSLAKENVIGPGGVLGSTVWYRANADVYSDAGVTPAINAGLVSQWNDNGTSATYHAGQTGAATLKPTYVTNGINFNPALNFDGGDYLVNSAPFANTFLNIPTGSGNTGTGSVFTVGYGTSATSNPLVSQWNSTNQPVFIAQHTTSANLGFNSRSTTVFASTPAVTSVPFVGKGLISGTTLSSGVNGKTVATATVPTGTLGTTVQPLYLGVISSGTGYLTGRLGEVVTFNTVLSPADQNKVESYLALKWGVTLGTTAALVNYTASNGTTVYWTGDATFQNNIAGIGRDNNATLLQKQTQSVNTASNGNVIAMGLGTIAVDNASNTGTIDADRSFMVWGDDNQATTFAAAVSGTAYLRMARCWKIQETGTIGAVQVRVPKSIFNNPGVVFMRSTDAVFTNADYIYSPSSSDATYYYFNNIDFGNGNFFTLAQLPTPGPGGLASGLQVWLKADAEVFSDAGTTAASNNTLVQQWGDQTANNNQLDNVTAAQRPTFIQNGLNFNPILRFGGGQFLSKVVPIIGAVGTGAKEYFAVTTNVTNTGNGVVLNISPNPGSNNTNISYGIINNTGTGVLTSGGTTYNTMKALPNAGSVATPHVLNTTNAAAANMSTWTMYSDGLATGAATTSGTDAAPNVTAVNSNLLVGAKLANTVNTVNSQISGDIAEVVFYNAQQANRAQIQSYLALKYGITLGTTASVIDYKSSSGAATWTGDATYQNNITGIGRDDISCLNQKQSKSVNTTGLVTIANGDIAASNPANTNAFAADQTSLLFGDNAGATTFLTPISGELATNQMARVWKTTQTNSIGTAKFSIPANLFTAGATAYMFISTDPTFTSADEKIALTLNGANYEASPLLLSRANTTYYFTFAQKTVLPVTLTLAMTAVPSPSVLPAGSLDYTLTLANTSANTAYNVKVKDQLPAGVTLGTVTPPVGTTWDAATRIWTISSLNGSANISLTIPTTVQ
jgi:uncharacterized repeat protein (TIGR01451 family)